LAEAIVSRTARNRSEDPPAKVSSTAPYARRRSLLELAPLELDCMTTLWPLGEGTVRQIRDGLATTRPRAYTTIMTIMGRLERKGIVERRKAGRGYVYKPALTAEQARSHALKQMVESFFGGSHEAMLAEVNRHCAAQSPSTQNSNTIGGAVFAGPPSNLSS
jgi:predicted transcriptional regulator